VKWQASICCAVVLFVLGVSSSCSVDVSGRPAPPVIVAPGPPPHAPAPGYRRKYTYRYYPSAFVYFDVDRKVYFYLHHGSWTMGVALPAHIHIDADEVVSLSLETDKPYRDFEDHKAAHPPRGPKPQGRGPEHEGKPGGRGRGR